MCGAETPLLEIANHTNILGANFLLDLNFTSDDAHSLSQDQNLTLLGILSPENEKYFSSSMMMNVSESVNFRQFSDFSSSCFDVYFGA